MSIIVDLPPDSTSLHSTKRKHAGAYLEELEELGLLYALPVAAIARDESDTVLCWNSAAEEMYGWSADEAIGQKFSTLLSTDLSEPLHKFFYEVMRKQNWNGEFTHRRKGGQAIVVESNCSFHSLKFNGRSVVICIDRDITDQKNAKRENLENEFRNEDFLATLGHELRNPLSILSSAVRIGKRTGESFTGETQEVVDRQLKLLSHLIDDLLDLSRISKGKIHLNLQTVQPEVVVQQVIHQTLLLFKDKKHGIEFRCAANMPPLQADAVRLEQIISNLLNNACKYTPAGGKIVLQLQSEGKELCIRVTDNGIGISTESMAHIFELYNQGEAPFHQKRGGLGVGLAVVRRLVELHNGSISAFSDGPGKGSTFLIRLPYQQIHQ